jgi:hypothetical protein
MIGLLTLYQYAPCGGFQLELSNITRYGINEMKATISFYYEQGKQN